jgi:hypothetical protein
LAASFDDQLNSVPSNALAEALTPRDFGEMRHFAEFGGFSVWKCS